MSVRRADALTISFPLVDSSNRPARYVGLIPVTGNCKISKDGAAFANTTNLPAEISSSGRYSLALTAAEMDADWVHVYVSNAGVDDWDQLIGTSGNPSGTVLTSGSNTTSTFLTDLASATNDFWKDCLLLFTSGTLAGQVKKVTAYNGSTKFITVSGGYTGTPANTDRFVLVNI